MTDIETRIDTLLAEGAFELGHALALETLDGGVPTPEPLQQLAWRAARILGLGSAFAPPDDPIIREGLSVDEAVDAGEPELARQHAEAAAALAADHPKRRGWSRRRLAELDVRWGDPRSARAVLASLRQDAASSGDRYGTARADAAIAEVDLQTGDLVTAVEHAMAAFLPANEGGWRRLKHRTAALCRVLGKPVGRVPRDAHPEAHALDELAGLREVGEPLVAAERLCGGMRAIQTLPPANRAFVLRLAAPSIEHVELDWLQDGSSPPVVLVSGAREVWRDGRPIARWKRSKLLFALFSEIAAAGGTLDRPGLYERVWELPYRPPTCDNQLFVAIRRVRERADLRDLELVVREDGRYCLEPQPAVVRWRGDARRLRARVEASTKTTVRPRPSEIVGRTHDMERLEQYVDDHPLTTLVGPPGVGKTRMALECAHRFEGPVWWCELESASDASDALRVVAAEIGCVLGQREPARAVAIALTQLGHGLLILDNAEHVLDLTKALEAILEQPLPCRILVTSRRSLRSARETVLPLEPLPLPDAITLFEARCEVAGKATKVRALLRRVHGLPLAIEMIAALTRWMSVEELLARPGVGDLQQAIEVSWGLLDDAERAALTQCTVFRGGFSLTAAEQIVDLSGIAGAGAVIEVIERLVDQSLIRRWRPAHDPGQVRLDLYPSVVEFAAPRLASAEAVELRHTQWAGRVAVTLLPDLIRNDASANQRGRQEFANLRAAFERGGADVASMQCLLALDAYSRGRVPTADQERRLRDGLERTPKHDAAARAPLHLAYARLLSFESRRDERAEQAQLALQAALAAQDTWVEACAHVHIAMTGRYTEGDAHHLQRALELARDTRSASLEGHVLANYAGWRLMRGDQDGALRDSRAARALLDTSGRPADRLKARRTLLEVLRRRNDWERIRKESAELEELARRQRAHFYQSFAAFYQGMYQQLHGRTDRALEAFQRALEVSRFTGSVSGEAVSLTLIATAHLDVEDWAAAERALQQARLLGEDLGSWILGDVLEGLAMLRLDQGDVTQGLADLERAHETNEAPDARAACAIWRGVALRMAGQRVEADAALDEAVDGLAAQKHSLQGCLAAITRAALRTTPGVDARAALHALEVPVRKLALPELTAMWQLCSGQSVELPPSVRVRLVLRALHADESLRQDPTAPPAP